MAWEQFAFGGPQTSDSNRTTQEQPYMSSMMMGNGAYNPYTQQTASMMGPWASIMNGMNTMNNLGSQIGGASAFANALSSANMQSKYPYQAMLQAEQMKGDRMNSLLNSPFMQLLFGGGGGLSGMTSNFGQSVSMGGGGGGSSASPAPAAPAKAPLMKGGPLDRNSAGFGMNFPSATNSASNAFAGYRPAGQKPNTNLRVDGFGSNPQIRR